MKPLNPFLPLMGGLIILAWITLWVWEQSPYGRYLNHQEPANLGLDPALTERPSYKRA